jgi:hypothetical protein
MEDPVKRPPVYQELKQHLEDHKSIPRPQPDTFLKEGVIVRGTLTHNECRAIIDLTEGKGYQDAKDYCHMYFDRYNDRLMADDPELSQFIWDRVKEFIPQRVRAFEEEWELDRLNTRFRFCKYTKDMYFGAHTDGTYMTDQNHRSILTCMFYLNGHDDFKGGLTNFIHYKGKKLKYSVVPEPGLCVIFPQANLDFYHEGTKVTDGLKYIMRTDVMYRKI